jgi:hypothetical protein
MDSTLRFLRILHGTLLFSMLLYIAVAEKILTLPPRAVERTFFTGMAVSCVSVIVIAVFLRFKILGSALDTLRSTPNDPASLAQWRRGVIVSDVLAESAVLFGFALRFTGATMEESLPFYLAGVGLMVLWWPRRP